MSAPPHLDLTDLAVVAVGDRAAMDDLMRWVREVAHRYCRARLLGYGAGQQLADDVAQEICIAVLEALPDYEHRGVPFEAFVYAISSRKVADVQRVHHRSPLMLVEELPETDPAESTEQHVLDRIELEDVLTLLDALPERLREVLVMRIALAMSAEQVGRALGMTPGSVRIAQHRALQRVRELHRNRNATRGGVSA